MKLLKIYICRRTPKSFIGNMKYNVFDKFDTNALILKLTMVTYNILRIIGTESMNKNDMPVRHSTIKRRLAPGSSNSRIQTSLRLVAAF